MKKSSTRHKQIVYITVYALPALLTASFYALRPFTSVMDLFGQNAAVPIRSFLGLISSIIPFSLAEILCTLTIVWFACFLIITIIKSVQYKSIKILSFRLITLIVVALYIWSCYCWLWGSAYYETNITSRNGLSRVGISAAELEHTTRLFLHKANELAPLQKRDIDGKFNESISEFFAASDDLYKNLSLDGLNGKQYQPKPMLYSRLFSRLGYTGFYFALTGEANINIDAPSSLIPATIAHEMAHQLGVSSEEEANFLAVAACAASGNTVYEYSGYLMGLISLMNALFPVDSESWFDIRNNFATELEQDWTENSEYWQTQETVKTGVAFLDETLTAATEIASESISVFYDGYLKSYGQELGIRSYGAYVDLLVEWFR